MKLLTVEEAAELGVGVRLVRRIIAEKRIEYTKIGKHVRIPDVVLDAYIAAGRVDPTADAPRPGPASSAAPQPHHPVECARTAMIGRPKPAEGPYAPGSDEALRGTSSLDASAPFHADSGRTPADDRHTPSAG